jgi:hypothetical protein
MQIKHEVSSTSMLQKQQPKTIQLAPCRGSSCAAVRSKSRAHARSYISTTTTLFNKQPDVNITGKVTESPVEILPSAQMETA